MNTMMNICKLIGAEDGGVKNVAADDVDKVEGDRGDEGISEHALDPPRQTFENSRHHGRITPVLRASGQPWLGLLFIAQAGGGLI